MPSTIQKTSWLPELLSRLAVASGVGYVAAAYTVSRWLTRPNRGRPGQMPDEFGFTAERVECLTTDYLRLVGWAIAPPRPRGTVALFHGYRKNRGQTLGRIAFLVEAGYRCVAFDHRAHGESNGKRVSFGYYEGRDVAAVLDLVRRRWPQDPHAALGISMGGAALCFAGPRVRPDAVILESVYRDVGSAFARRIGTDYPAWFQRISQGAIWVTERRLGVRLNQVAPVEHVSSLAPAPVLVMTGTDDHHAPPEDSELLLERCRGPREMWLVPKARHSDTFEVGGTAYQERVLDFLDRWLDRRVQG
jgi:alpha-beta hydrolase superfamily lysophospholipase